MSIKNITCKACGTGGFVLLEQTFANGTRHIRAQCQQCDTFFQYLPQTEAPAELTPVGEIIVPFGKHKGLKLKDVPRDYLEWMASNDKMSTKWQAIAKAGLKPDRP